MYQQQYGGQQAYGGQQQYAAPQQQAYGGGAQYQQQQQQQQQAYHQPQTQSTAQPAPAATAPAADESKPAPIQIDTQHDDMVHDAQLDFYGTKLATGSSDRTIKVYDISGNSYTPNATLSVHSGPVYQLAWSHPKYGTLLASASFDGSVQIHRESPPGQWKCIKSFVDLHESSVNGVEFAPQEYGLVAASGSSDGRVAILSHGDDDSWTVEYLKDTPLGVNAVSWAPYGVATRDGTEEATPARIATGGSDNGVRIWRRDPATGAWEQEPFESSDPSISHGDWVRDVAFAPRVIPGRSVVASCSEDGTVIIWSQGGDNGDSDDGKWTPTVLNKFEGAVWRVSWSITGNILAVSSGDSNVTLWKEALDGTWSEVSKVEDTARDKQ